jgi:hypothetical protein
VGEDNRLAPSGSVLLNHRAPTPPPEPSWGRVLATTVKLWVLRRWRVVAAVAGVAVVTVAALGFGGVFTGTAATAVRARAADRSSRASTAPRRPGSAPGAAAGAAPAAAARAAAVRAEAAEWIAGQVSGDAIIACDPVMCTALQARGVAATRLISLTERSTDPRGAAVVVTSAAAYHQYAPAVIASFGSGAERIVVRAAEPGGTSGYQSALRADLQARMSGGAQLLRNNRIRFTAQDAAQLRNGEVDARVLATLAALSSQYSFSVTAFGDAAPGAAVLYRGVTVAGTRLESALALVKAQDQPYLPAYAAIVQPAGGQPTALSFEFTAPSPLGLLTAVLTADRSSAAS